MAGFDASNAAMILSAAADITFVVNADGIVSDRVMTSPEMPEELFIGWPGKALVDLVTLESRPKIEQMLRDVAIGAPGRLAPGESSDRIERRSSDPLLRNAQWHGRPCRSGRS